MTLEEKLLAILPCIELTCNSAVKHLDSTKHSNKLAGFASFEERTKALIELSEQSPTTIKHLFKKGGHHYFGFNGRPLKIVSSSLDYLSKNVYKMNSAELHEEEQEGLDLNDPLLRIVYKTDYDLENHEATVLECNYLEIDRLTHQIIKRVDILHLSRHSQGFIEEITEELSQEVEIPSPSLLKTAEQEHKKD